MEPITINATELRNKTRDLMERVKYHGDVFLVETFGRPMVVILSVEEFQSLTELAHASSSLVLPLTKKKKIHPRARKRNTNKTKQGLMTAETRNGKDRGV